MKLKITILIVALTLFSMANSIKGNKNNFTLIDKEIKIRNHLIEIDTFLKKYDRFSSSYLNNLK